MKPQWIDCGSSAIFIGPFWMGTSEEIARTQEVIDEETDLYTDDSAKAEIEDSTSTEIGETHYDRQ